MAVRAQGPIIDLKDGKIEGKFYHTKKGIETQYFLGVPYAKPPIGNLRFQKPVPLDRWHDVKVCRKFAPRAIQKNDPFEQNGGIPDSENCLYLNIFGPQNASNNKKLYPVIMFIHGGSCVNGSPVAYGDTNICETLCSQGAVVVTVQYRLGFLGLLYLDDEITPTPNLCMWDLKAALEWIHENIENFHGDKDNVTVMGHSSGSALVEFLCLSPLTKDLIHRAILLSGNRFIIQFTKKILRERCMQFLKSIGWEDFYETKENHQKILDFLKGLKANDFRMNFDVDLAPVIGTEFLPYKNLKEMQEVQLNIPVLMGASQFEGLLFAYFAKSSLEDNDIKYKALLETVSNSLGLEVNLKTKNFHKMHQYYDRLIREGQRERAIIELIGDWVVHENVWKFLDLHSTSPNPIFLYNFEHFNEKSLVFLEGYTKVRGSTHGIELAYIFGKSTHLPFEFSEDDQKVSELFAQAIINFSTTGDPNVPRALSCKWKHVTSSETWTCCLGSETRMEQEYNRGKRFI